MTKRLLFCLFLVTAFVGCDSGSDMDAYAVALSDDSGVLVYTGLLDLAIEAPGPADEPGEVSGRWHLDGVGAVPDLAPGAGTVRGSLAEGEIFLGLDMNASDSGLDLSGTYDGDRISGTWSTVTIAGPMPGGTFEAERE